MRLTFYSVNDPYLYSEQKILGFTVRRSLSTHDLARALSLNEIIMENSEINYCYEVHYFFDQTQLTDSLIAQPLPRSLTCISCTVFFGQCLFPTLTHLIDKAA